MRKIELNNNSPIVETCCVIISIMAGALTYISRIGFENYGNVIVKSVLITVCVIMAPTLLKLKYSINESNNQWYLSKIILLIWSLIILIILGNLNNIFDGDLSLLLSVLSS